MADGDGEKMCLIHVQFKTVDPITSHSLRIERNVDKPCPPEEIDDSPHAVGFTGKHDRGELVSETPPNYYHHLVSALAEAKRESDHTVVTKFIKKAATSPIPPKKEEDDGEIGGAMTSEPKVGESAASLPPKSKVSMVRGGDGD